MADSAVVGALRIILGIDAAEVETGGKRAIAAIGRVEAAIGQAGNNMVGSLRGIALGFAAAFGPAAIGLALKHTIDLADETYKMAQGIGVSAEALSRLQYSAMQSGLEQEDLRKGMNKLVVAFDEVKDRSSGAARAFAVLGLDASSAVVKNKDLIGTLDVMADKFKGSADGANKTAVVMELLGAKMGSKWVPLLNSGSAALRENAKASDELGRTLTTSTGKAAEEFNDTLTRANAGLQAVYLQVVAKVLPSLQGYATVIEDASKNTERMRSSVNFLAGGIEAVSRVFSGAILGAQRFAAEMGAAWEYTKALFDGVPGSDVKAMRKLIEEGELTKAMFELLKKENDTVWSGWVPRTVEAAEALKKPQLAAKLTADEFRRMQDTAGKALLETSVVASPLIRSLADLRNVQDLLMKDQLTYADMAEPTMAKIKAALDAGKINWEQYKQIAGEALNIARQFRQDELAAVMDETTSTIQAKMAALRTALDGGAISYRQYGKAIKDVEKQNQDNMLSTASLAASTITAVFSKNKAAAIAAAVINTAVGITKAMELPPPFSWAQAALVAATGAAQIAAIKSTSADGGGGSPTVGGGGGSAAEAAPAQQPAAQTLEIIGLDSGAMFSREAVRGLMMQMSQLSRDGVRIVIK